MNDSRTLIIIINWRQPDLTAACVAQTRRLLAPGVEILLIDNGSGDGSAAQLAATFPEIPLLALPENGGFAAGANAGLRRAVDEGFDYALLLNNDAFPAPDMLERLLAETADDIALLSPKILYDDARDRVWFAGGRQHPYLLEMRDSGLEQPDGPAWSQTRDVDYLLGTGLLVNLAAARKVGWLDERYFMYYEDLDWSIRLRQAGYRLRLVADAHLYHRVSSSSGGSDSPLQRYHLARSSILFFRRHASSGLPPAIVLYRAGSAVKKIGQFILSGNVATARAYLRGLVDGWRESARLVAGASGTVEHMNSN